MTATDVIVYLSEEARHELRIFKATLGLTYDGAIKTLLESYKTSKSQPGITEDIVRLKEKSNK